MKNKKTLGFMFIFILGILVDFTMGYFFSQVASIDWYAFTLAVVVMTVAVVVLWKKAGARAV